MTDHHDDILKEAVFKGIVRDVYVDCARVAIVDENGRVLENFFPLVLFKSRKPHFGDKVEYHVQQLKTGKYDGYFDIMGSISLSAYLRERLKQWIRNTGYF